MHGNIGDPKNISQAARVSRFLEKMSKDHPQRWRKVQTESKVGFPFGDMAYGMSLMTWYKSGRPKNAFFSWAEGQMADPYIIEFRKELTIEFDLLILTTEEANQKRASVTNILETKVTDWGPN